MAKYLSNYNLALVQYIKLIATSLITVITLLVFCEVSAETLTDPTLPPFKAGSTVRADPEEGPILQSIMRGSNYQAAIINGKKIFLGGKYGEATLVRLSENEATLRSPDMKIQVLKMQYPIKKRLIDSVEPIKSHNHSKLSLSTRTKKQGN